MTTVPFDKITITDGFWKDKQRLVSSVTVDAVYDRFAETGRIATMSCQPLEIKPHFFWGSDVFKWMEGAAYISAKEKRPDLEQKIESIIDDIERGITEDGYYNSYYNSLGGERFSDRDKHELYSLGHMIEAGVAYYQATGRRRLLDLCIRNVDLVYRIFVTEQSAGFVTPGHEEIELALLRLYAVTHNQKHLELAEFFINQRGQNQKDRQPFGKYLDREDYGYCQSHLPVRRQSEAVGHAVRLLYLYCGVADLAKETGDSELLSAAERIFDSIYSQKMYITGSMGVSNNAESFSRPYDLPNYQAYAETCAALALALFGDRMSKLTKNGKYGDAVERAIYNGMLSGLSLDGQAFFYVNPLEIDLSKAGILRLYQPKFERQRVFKCSCCPPNLVRFIPSVGNLIYSTENDVLFVHQYIANTAEIDGGNVTLSTRYPMDGKVSVSAPGKRIALRRPAWCRTIRCKIPFTEQNGYLYFETDTVEIEFVMKPRFVAAHPLMHDNVGRVALMRGPIVYCAEGKDQCADLYSLRIDPEDTPTEEPGELDDLPQLIALGEQLLYGEGPYAEPSGSIAPLPIRLNPYYTFANRGEDNMLVWLPRI